MDSGGTVHHDARMRPADCHDLPSSGTEPQRMLRPGSTEHMSALKGAIRDAMQASVQLHHQAGRSVFVLDDEGNLCARPPAGPLRRLARAEIDAALAAPLEQNALFK